MTYGPAGQLLTLSWMNYTETRQYNNLLQMTRLTAAGGSQGSLDLEYKFSSTQNNGRITAMKDWVTGEEVQYTYDALQRLTRAETIGPEWGSTYGYDGFGNLLQKTPVKGSGVPLLNIAVDPWTNRVSGLSGGSYDANGNDLTAGAFDIANRLKQSGSTYFQYDAANKRVWKGTVAGGAITSEEFYFYAPWGAKLAAYKPTNYLNVATMTIVSSNEYFGGKLIKINGTAVLTDRLGSNVSNGKRYFPYGEERGSTANNIEKFGTYFRDAETGLDYTDQRYYKGSWGRFVSSGPFEITDATDPGEQNRFAYVSGDPVNWTDPEGLVKSPVIGFQARPPKPPKPPRPPIFPPFIIPPTQFPPLEFPPPEGPSLADCLEAVEQYKDHLKAEFADELHQRLSNIDPNPTSSILTGAVAGAFNAAFNQMVERMGVTILSAGGRIIFGTIVGGVIGGTTAVLWGPVKGLALPHLRKALIEAGNQLAELVTLPMALNCFAQY